MPVWKADLVFEANGRGWEETYYKNFATANFSGVSTELGQLADKRIALCGQPVIIKAYRISDPTSAGRQGQAIYFNPVKAATLEPAGTTGAAAPSAAINVGFINTATNKTRRIQMRGIWDAAITKFDRLDSPEYATWSALFATWRTFVLIGYGWMTRDTIGDPSRATYSYDIDPVIPEFTFDTDWFAALDVNKFRMIRLSRFNGSRSPLNRELIVYVTARNKAVAAAPIAAGPMVSPGRAIRYAAPAFIAADNIGVEKVGRRAPGAPLLHTPGRARARARI